jgi:hypothetical protein
MHLSTILGPFKYDHEKYRYLFGNCSFGHTVTICRCVRWYCNTQTRTPQIGSIGKNNHWLKGTKTRYINSKNAELRYFLAVFSY